MNIEEYEVHSGCGARRKIFATSLINAKAKATKLGLSRNQPIVIRNLQGDIVAKKAPQSGSLWTTTKPYITKKGT